MELLITSMLQKLKLQHPDTTELPLWAHCPAHKVLLTAGVEGANANKNACMFRGAGSEVDYVPPWIFSVLWSQNGRCCSFPVAPLTVRGQATCCKESPKVAASKVLRRLSFCLLPHSAQVSGIIIQSRNILILHSAPSSSREANFSLPELLL